MVTDDPKVRAEKVLRGGMIFLGVLAVVGIIALLVSLPNRTDDTATGTASPSVNIKQQKRASAAAARVSAGIAAWANRINGVCNAGRANYPNIKYGFDTNLPDMAYGVGSLVRGVNGVAQPKDPTANDQLLPVRTRGQDLVALWTPLGKRPQKDVSPQERAAAVDEVRSYMQDLIDRGAKNCDQLIPQPNPPLATPTPAGVVPPPSSPVTSSPATAPVPADTSTPTVATTP